MAADITVHVIATGGGIVYAGAVHVGMAYSDNSPWP